MNLKLKLATIVFCGALLGAQAQTTLIEWQTNWPSGTGGNLATNTTLPDSSPWFTGTQAALAGTSTGTKTNLVATIGSGSLTYWTYFTPSNVPVSLAPKSSLKVSFDFNVIGSGSNSSRGLKIGLLYAGTNNGVGQTYWNGTGYTPSGTPKQTNYLGYVQTMNFGTNFGQPPLSTFAYTNNGMVLPTSASLLAQTTNAVAVEGNGGGTTNDVGFLDTTNYTFVMTITNINATNTTITTTISGPGLSNSVDHTSGYISLTVLDTNFCYTNFDTVCFRPAANNLVATTFTITSFKVEKIIASATLPSPYLTNSVSGGNLHLSWGSAYLGYWLQSRASLTTGSWSDVAGSSATTSVSIPINPATGSIFYRLSSVP